MTKTQQAAQWLGRRGGSANTPAQNSARAINALQGGRPRLYRVQAGRVEHRPTVGDPWAPVVKPYDRPARRFLKRHQDRIAHSRKVA